MKKFSKLLLALGGISAVGAGLAVGMVNNNVKAAEQTKATGSANVSAIRLYVEDQINWTSSGNDAIAHCYSPTFVSNSGYSALSDISGTGITVGADYFECAMTWVDAGGRHYQFVLPWYIQSMSYCYRNTNRIYVNNSGDKTVSAGTNTLDYVYSGNNTSYTSQSSTYTTAVNTYSVALSDGASTIQTATVNEQTKYSVATDPVVPWKTKTAGWYTDAAKTISFTNGTKITADTTLYGTYSVTAASFASQIMTYESGDKVTSDCSSKYTTAKAYMEVMVDKANFTSANYPEAYSRWIKWKAANKDTSVDPASNVAQSDKSNVVVLGALAAIAVLAAGGYFFVRKKKNA